MFPPNLESIINAMTGIASPIIKDKLQRNEIVINGFEKHEIWAEDDFEFILKMPIRHSFDRILVRGVAGEVGLSDVMALAQSVQEHKTDEGWLVSTRRISRAAREFVKKEENHRLDCYTFDDLIDLDADFSGYLDWLEAEIKRRKIDTKYVPLACTKEEIDPVSKLPIGVSRYEEEDGWIDGYIDLWLDDPAKEHISVLGEFGTGKTWFALHYAWVALQRYRDAQKRGVERPRLPLVITLRDYANHSIVLGIAGGDVLDMRRNSSGRRCLSRSAIAITPVLSNPIKLFYESASPLRSKLLKDW